MLWPRTEAVNSRVPLGSKHSAAIGFSPLFVVIFCEEGFSWNWRGIWQGKIEEKKQKKKKKKKQKKKQKKTSKKTKKKDLWPIRVLSS
ncbi:unnamed protein product [Spirodela intermedia]|uniref:Uncharacterized protein n=1 Tax=Spirodela intermedia TaxID=51605 RepID=A0ABN7E9B2_SPIIN|nr:unnamed protein product [Spirodela intermedia]